MPANKLLLEHLGVRPDVLNLGWGFKVLLLVDLHFSLASKFQLTVLALKYLLFCWKLSIRHQIGELAVVVARLTIIRKYQILPMRLFPSVCLQVLDQELIRIELLVA